MSSVSSSNIRTVSRISWSVKPKARPQILCM